MKTLFPGCVVVLCCCVSSDEPQAKQASIDVEPSDAQPGPMTAGRYVGSVTLIEAPTQCTGGPVPVWDLLGQPEPMANQWIVLPFHNAPPEGTLSLLVSIRPLEAGEWIDMSPSLPGCWLLVHPDFLVPSHGSASDAWPDVWHSEDVGQVRWINCPLEMAMFTYHLQLVVTDRAGMRGSNALQVKIGH